MIRLKSALICVLVLCSPVLADRVERLIDKWRPEHYIVNITLNEGLSEITSASARISVVIVKPTSVIDLDFGELTTDKVSLDSKSLSFTHKNGKLEVTLPAPASPGTRLTLTVDYHGKPKDGLLLTADKDGKPAAVGDNWPNRVHHWIPTLDHPSAKATITFNITAPAREEVVVARPGFVFIHGHWMREGGRWRWHDGSYVRERPGYSYEEGRWDHRGGRRVWIEGHWRSRG